LQHHSCALSSSGGVFCWGRNGGGQVMLVVCVEGAVLLFVGCAYRADDCVFDFAQVGDGTTTQRNTPVSVAGLTSGVAKIALSLVRRVLECFIADCCEGAGLLLLRFELFFSLT
jgi:hypothetical protein